jgi:PST family polysaccharide transporter
MSALSMAIVFPIFVFARPIVSWAFGPSFEEAAGVLRVLVLTTPFVFLGMAHGMWEINENLTRLSFQKTMIGAGLNIVLNLWLIPHYAATGAAIATLVSYLVVNTLLIGVFSRTRPMFRMQIRSLSFFRRLPSLLRVLP